MNVPFSVTFDFGDKRETPLLAALPGDAVPLGDDLGLWRAEDDSLTTVLHAPEFVAMQVCARFQPRDAHVAAVREQLRLPDADAAALVDALVARGLLLSPDAFIAAPPLPVQAEALPDPLIAIRAHDLPDELHRLLQSLLAHERDHGAGRRYLVVDDTTDAASAGRCKKLVDDFAEATASRVWRLGPEHRSAVMSALAAELDADARHALAALVDPAYPTAITGSRGYNLAMLAAAGGAISLLDHDTFLPFRTPPGAQRAFELRDSTANETGWLDDAGYDTLTAVAGDAFAGLRELVGRPVAEVLAREGWQRAALVDRDAAALLPLRRAPTLLGAFGGVYGGVAFNSSSVLVAGSPGSLQRLWREPYRHQRLEGDRVWHGTVSPRITSYAVYSPLLLDTRELVPFTGTWGRVDDTFFLALLGAMVPRAAYAFMPLLVGHEPPGSRERMRRGLEPLLLDRNGWLAAEFDHLGSRLPGEDRAARLAAVGAHAAAIAGCSDVELAHRYARWREGQIARFADRVAQALDDHPDAPAQWRAYAQQALAVNREAASEASRASSLGAEESRTLRAAWTQVAAASRFWPHVWQRARSLPLLDGLVAAAGR